MKKDEQSLIIPMPSSEAVNNVQIKDMTPQSDSVYMTVAEFNERMRESRKLDTMNLWTVNMTIMSKNTELGGIKYQMIDGKKSDIPMVTEDGEIFRYASKYSINVTYTGCSETYFISKEFYDAFDVGSSYLMKFHRGLVTTFGVAKPDMILDSFEYR